MKTQTTQNYPVTHTSGPWNFVRDGFRITLGNEKTSNTTTPHDYMVAEIADNSFQAEANARLIAAAPDLLAALQRMTRAVDDYDGNIPADIDSPYHQALAAIAKAIGGEL
jgi:hypothetical protein